MLDSMFTMVGVLLSVAFFTLVERKTMALAHYRKGPNKILLFGILQPVADAVKLMTKEFSKTTSTKQMMFFMGPMSSLGIMLIMWAWFEFSFGMIPSNMKMLLLFATLSLGAYGMLMMSWGSNSKYAILGGHRAVAQMMSYEVCLFLTILMMPFMWKAYSSVSAGIAQQGLWVALFTPPLFLTWILLCLAESNRTPFDMAEGESEIVSGFNVEYGGGLFALIFISEYGMIMALSFISSIFFLGTNSLLLKSMVIMLLFVWVRCAFPRVRYDNLMMLSWKMALPYSIVSLNMALLV